MYDMQGKYIVITRTIPLLLHVILYVVSFMFWTLPIKISG